MTQIQKTISELQKLINQLKVGDAVLPVKPLYEAAYEALQDAGRPIATKDLLPRIRKAAQRPRLSYAKAYQALEYCKKHKHTVKRTHGKWQPMAQVSNKRTH